MWEIKIEDFIMFNADVIKTGLIFITENNRVINMLHDVSLYQENWMRSKFVNKYK